MNRLLNSIRGKGFWRKPAVTLATVAYLGLALVPAAQASDTEVYAGSKGITTSEMAPTLMMQLDSNRTVAIKDRFDTLLSAMHKVLYGSVADDVSPIPGYVRMGYSRYQVTGNEGGWVRYPARPLAALVDVNPNGYVVSAPAVSSDDAELKMGSAALTNQTFQTPSSTIAIRFPSLNVPRQATITNAYIEFTPSENGTPNDWKVTAQAIDDAPTFTALDGLLSRTYLPSITVTSTDTWAQNGTYKVNVTPLMQNVADRAGWCGGNAAVFKVDNSANLKGYTFDNSAATAPRLVVEFTMTDPVKMANSCITAPISQQFYVSAGSDDIEKLASGVLATSNDSLSVVKNKVALRFVDANARLAQGAVLSSAILYLTGNVPGKGSGKITGVPAMTVSAFDTDNQAAFCSGSCTYPTGTTLAGVSWNPGTVTDGVTYQVPVTSAVQTILNKAGWAPGHALGFDIGITSGSSTNAAAIRSYESTTGGRALLEIKGTQRYTDLTKMKTVRDDIWDELQKMTASNGATPLGDAYQETMRYMLGLNVSHTQAGADARVLTPATSMLTSGTDRQFDSPLKDKNQCAANYVFLLASGDWSNSSNINNSTSALTNNAPNTCSKTFYANEMDAATPGPDALGWACMLSTAKWGANATNQKRTIVRTSTVLFNDLDATVVKNNLARVATISGGQGFIAGNEKDLIAAILKTVDDLMKESGTITAPGVAVNQLNRLNNLDQLYYAVFQPTNGINWPGNVKRYQLDIVNQQVLDNDSPQKSAIDPVTSFFDSEARSWWLPDTDGDDGNIVEKGGVARVLPDPANRRMYAYIGSLPASSSGLTKVGSDPLLNSSFVNYVQTTNGLGTSVEAQNLINWYKGYFFTEKTIPTTLSDVTTLGLRRQVGAVLHSRPILVNYGYSGTATQAATDPDLQFNTIFFSSLEGTLHAVDAKTGIEQFSFIPGEKVATLKTLFENRVRSAPNDLNPEFGMDLTWSVYRKANATDPSGTPEKVYIYGGMRMGGSNYYALDVTDRSNPRLLFAIKGGSGDFTDMGQTWSQPVVSTMRINGTVMPVLVFAGGYDAAKYEIGGPTYPATAPGNKLYIVNAETGSLIWSSNESQMDSSIPSQPKAVDVDGDGLVDHIYVGDLGGKVFRVDVNNNNSGSSDLVKRVKLFASVGSGHRFYEPPTVALFMDSANKIYAAVAMGSGNRSHPLEQPTSDRFYTFFDYDVTRADILGNPTNLQTTIGESAMVKVDPASTTPIDPTGSSGWYLDMNPTIGEKVITSAVFFRNKLVFSSYVPSVESGNDCSPVIGSSNLYTITLTGGGVPSKITVKDQAVFGLGADPQIIILPDPNDPTKSNSGIVTGTDVELEGKGISAGLQRTRWYEQIKRTK